MALDETVEAEEFIGTVDGDLRLTTLKEVVHKELGEKKTAEAAFDMYSFFQKTRPEHIGVVNSYVKSQPLLFRLHFYAHRIRNLDISKILNKIGRNIHSGTPVNYYLHPK